MHVANKGIYAREGGMRDPVRRKQDNADVEFLRIYHANKMSPVSQGFDETFM